MLDMKINDKMSEKNIKNLKKKTVKDRMSKYEAFLLLVVVRFSVILGPPWGAMLRLFSLKRGAATAPFVFFLVFYFVCHF